MLRVMLSTSLSLVPAWSWRRFSLRHHRLQLWSQRGRKASHLQRTDKTWFYKVK